MCCVFSNKGWAKTVFVSTPREATWEIASFLKEVADLFGLCCANLRIRSKTSKLSAILWLILYFLCGITMFRRIRIRAGSANFCPYNTPSNFLSKTPFLLLFQWVAPKSLFIVALMRIDITYLLEWAHIPSNGLRTPVGPRLRTWEFGGHCLS